MYDNIATLKGAKHITYDKYLNEIVTYEEREVYVQPRGIYSSEFYQAAQTGLHPSITFDMANRADYNGEKLLTFEGVDYSIIRVDWNAQRDRISLICEERIGNEDISE